MLQPVAIAASKYRIERPLAEGGMGAVFVAKNVETEKKLTLRILFPHDRQV